MSRTDNPGPGLGVALSVTPVDDMNWADAIAVRVDVQEASAPLRVSIYLDGDLVDTWVPRATEYEVRLPDVRGRHVVTARVIDAEGRWGGASELVEG